MKNSLCLPRVMFVAPQGRSGKTTVTISVCLALRERGYQVQAFKRGPDYIDPSWLSFASGNACRNLDMFMMSREAISRSFASASLARDVSIVEGAMGLFDGLDAQGSCSSADLAKLLGVPVILVVNCERMSRSAAAMINGFTSFDPELNIAGVILNNVATARQKNLLAEAIRLYCNVEVLGYMPKKAQMSILSRHMGLVPAGEDGSLREITEQMRRCAEDNLDLERIMEIARQAPALAVEDSDSVTAGRVSRCRIGVIRDEIFSFYYEDNLEALQRAGAELVYIDSRQDSCLPELDGLYLGGGFPEMFAAEISANVSLRESIRQQIEAGLPAYAECGGLMYLCRELRKDGCSYPMVGALPLTVIHNEKPQGLGYVCMRVVEENPFYPVGTELKGHEFHYSSLQPDPGADLRYAFTVQRGRGIDGDKDGIVYRNLLATYLHIHACGTPNWAISFVQSSLEHKKLMRVKAER